MFAQHDAMREVRVKRLQNEVLVKTSSPIQVMAICLTIVKVVFLNIKYSIISISFIFICKQRYIYILLAEVVTLRFV